MMRICRAWISTKTVTRMRRPADSPIMSARAGSRASSAINANASAKTVAASSTVTPCFRTFAEALRESHVKRTHEEVYYTNGWNTTAQETSVALEDRVLRQVRGTLMAD